MVCLEKTKTRTGNPKTFGSQQIMDIRGAVTGSWLVKEKVRFYSATCTKGANAFIEKPNLLPFTVCGRIKA